MRYIGIGILLTGKGIKGVILGRGVMKGGEETTQQVRICNTVSSFN